MMSSLLGNNFSNQELTQFIWLLAQKIDNHGTRLLASDKADDHQPGNHVNDPKRKVRNRLLASVVFAVMKIALLMAGSFSIVEFPRVARRKSQCIPTVSLLMPSHGNNSSNQELTKLFDYLRRGPTITEHVSLLLITRLTTNIFGHYIYVDNKKARSQFYEKQGMCGESSTQILCQLCYNDQFMMWIVILIVEI